MKSGEKATSFILVIQPSPSPRHATGCRMITAFFVISGFFVLLIKCGLLEKAIIFVSALPIGLFCNTLRLIVTALVFTVLKGDFWEKAFHDFGGSDNDADGYSCHIF